MIRLLGFQFRNFYRRLTYYVYMFVALGMTLLSLMALSKSKPHMVSGNDIAERVTGLGLFELIVVCLFVTFDSYSGVVKNIVAKGYDKVKLLFSKYIVAIGFTIVFTLIKVLATMIYSNICSLPVEGLWSAFGKSLIFLIPQVLFFVTVCIVAGRFRNGIIISLLMDSMVPSLLITLNGLCKFSFNIVNYWVGRIQLLDTVPQIITGLIYTVVMVSIGIFAVRRREIK